VTEPEREEGSAGHPRIRPFLQSEVSAPAASSWNEPTGLRPFVLTSGRVRPPELSLETQVTAVWGNSTDGLGPEELQIVRLCVESLSVVEISARMGLHLGVVMILVGDLRAAGHLVVHEQDPDGPDDETISRVADGLRALS
jgi:hypothetical protein